MAPGVDFMRQSLGNVSSQLEKKLLLTEKSFNLSSDQFCQVEFSSEFTPHEIDPWYTKCSEHLGVTDLSDSEKVIWLREIA